jgi:FkbM family methyltransferase
MASHVTRRAMGDVRAVCGSASPVAATRWLTSLVTHLPECAKARSLSPADRVWAKSGASFTTPSGAVVSLPAAYCLGAREMYCRNVYLRTGLIMPTKGWVVDLGANRGLFSVWAALTGAQVIAVEAQSGFLPLIQELARHNRVAERVHVEIALASGVSASGAKVGIVADDRQWSITSHGAPTRPADVSIPQLMVKHRIDRIGLLKFDIEGGEFAVLAGDDDLSWLQEVDQIVLEIHRDFGDAPTLIDRLRHNGFDVELRDNDDRRVAATSHQLSYLYCRVHHTHTGATGCGRGAR